MGRQPLDTKDLRRLFDGVQRLYTLQDHASFTTTLVDVLASLVPIDVASYDELNPKTKKTFAKLAPHDTPLPENGFEILGRFLHQHPCVAHAHKTGDGSPTKISDFISINQWKRTPLYNEFYKHFRTIHNLGMQFASGRDRSTIVSMGFHRGGRDFLERDRSILNVLRPHLSQAYNNAQAVTEMRREVADYKRLIEHLDQAIIEVTPKGKVSWATPRAATLLHPAEMKSNGVERLPSPLSDWVMRQDRLLSQTMLLSTPLQPLDLELHGRQLRVRFIKDGERRLVILEERTPDVSMPILLKLGLSQRETEILVWVARGKANADIADILGISVRTVHKHMERIYQKLGIDNRHAAITIAMDAALQRS
jgi:DNA-binding CsgD family transcriptional regulator